MDVVFLQEDSYIVVMLWAIGYELLFSVGDSILRVLFVQQVGNWYKVLFEMVFLFDFIYFIILVEQVIKGWIFFNDYIVEVEVCYVLEIVYVYEIRNEVNSNFIFCQGWVLFKDCYNFVFIFLEDRIEMVVEGVEFIVNYYKYVVLAFIFFLLVGIVFYFSKR